MEILGIGFSELVFILIIAIIVLGPKDMEKAGRTIGRWLNNFVNSDMWKAFQRASEEIKNIPTSLMREANMDLHEMNNEIQNTIYPYSPSSASVSTRNPSQSSKRDAPDQPAADKPTDVKAGTEQDE